MSQAMSDKPFKRLEVLYDGPINKDNRGLLKDPDRKPEDYFDFTGTAAPREPPPSLIKPLSKSKKTQMNQ